MLTETGCAAVMFARGAMGNPFIFEAAKSFLTIGSWKAPEPAQKLDIALHHLEMLAEDLGEKRACVEMRKQFCAYTKGVAGFPGITGGSALRKKIIHAEKFADYRKIMDSTLC
jgi:tRNA-dihydrouridine synthase